MDKIIYRSSSPWNKYLEVAREDGNLVLNTENGNYSFGNLHKVFSHVFEREHFLGKTFKNILLLGMGAGSVINLLKNKFQQDGHITAIEIDADIIRIAGEYFELNQYRGLTVENADAYTYVNRTINRFDLIIVDIYIDLDVPQLFESNEFIDQLFHISTPGGMIIYNKVVTDNPQLKSFRNIMAYFEFKGSAYHYHLLESNKIIVSHVPELEC